MLNSEGVIYRPKHWCYWDPDLVIGWGERRGESGSGYGSCDVEFLTQTLSVETVKIDC